MRGRLAALVLATAVLTGCGGTEEETYTDCRIADYEPKGSLPTHNLPVKERSCDAETDLIWIDAKEYIADVSNDRPVNYICADGWVSYSVGKPGACSWHGGVARVTYYDPDDGTYHTTP